MSNSIAVKDVSKALKRMLESEMSIDVPVTILSPDEDSSEEQRLNLFLYRIEENVFLRNADWQPKKDDPLKIVPPPLTLNLHYLLTPYVRPDSEDGHADAHAILGEAMLVLHKNAVIPETYFSNGFQDLAGYVKTTPVPLSVDDLGKIWNAFKNPFRLSVAYEVSLVQIDIGVEKPMPKRVEKARVLSVETGFQHPRVQKLSPMRGHVGDTVQVLGENLAGWKASVKVGDKTALEDFDIQDESSFPFTVPADLIVGGMYEVTINVGNVERAVFNFEVIAL